MRIWREWTGGETEGTRLPERAKQQAMQNTHQDHLVTTMMKMTCGHRIGARPNGPLLNNTLSQRSFCQLVIDGNCKEEPSLIKQPPANVTILKLSWMDPDHNKSSADFYLSGKPFHLRDLSAKLSVKKCPFRSTLGKHLSTKVPPLCGHSGALFFRRDFTIFYHFFYHFFSE